jgi:hypothetical protein
MSTLRFCGLAAGLFFAVFFGMKWMLTIHPLKPDARIPTFHHVDVNSDEYKYQQSSASDGDVARDRLRNNVIDYAKALYDDPCNKALRASYIKAAVAYVRAWISIDPCIATQTCGGSADTQRLDRAAQAFGTPLDLRVREAMQRTHKRAGFHVGDFPDDTVYLLSGFASDPLIDPHADVRIRQIAMDGSTAQDCGH